MLIGKDLFCAKIHNECVQCLCCLCSTEHTAGLQKFWVPAILVGRTRSKLGEHGGHGEHGKDRKHQEAGKKIGIFLGIFPKSALTPPPPPTSVHLGIKTSLFGPPKSTIIS